MSDTDRDYIRVALDQARKSEPEDGRTHPLVGAVVVKHGQVLATAYRGEVPGAHAEFVALEQKLPDRALAGATVFTTLEPCTSRNHPKLPCAERIIARRVSRVVIGMLDPNQSITGRGIRRLREAGIAVDLFPPELMDEAEEMNRHFTEAQRERHAVGEIVVGTSEVVAALEKLCLSSERSVRLLIHALGIEYKLPESLARRLARHIRDRESEQPVRFSPVIVVDRSVTFQDLAPQMSARAAVYEEEGVSQQTRPRFIRADEPLGLDVLIVDDRRVMLMLTTAGGSKQVQYALVFERPPQLVAEFRAWFTEVVNKRTMSLDEFSLSLKGTDTEHSRAPGLDE